MHDPPPAPPPPEVLDEAALLWLAAAPPAPPLVLDAALPPQAASKKAIDSRAKKRAPEIFVMVVMVHSRGSKLGESKMEKVAMFARRRALLVLQRRARLVHDQYR